MPPPSPQSTPAAESTTNATSPATPERFDRLRSAILAFATERAWGPFHDPKNLAMAIGVEAGELMDHFRWVANDASLGLLKDPRTREGVEDEAADVLILLVEFAATCGIDLLGAAERKLERNAERYPVSLSRGRAEKHDRLGSGGAGAADRAGEAGASGPK